MHSKQRYAVTPVMVQNIRYSASKQSVYKTITDEYYDRNCRYIRNRTSNYCSLQFQPLSFDERPQSRISVRYTCNCLAVFNMPQVLR